MTNIAAITAENARLWPSAYSKDTLSKDFRVVRALEFPAEEKLPKNKRRKVMDFRRSGAVEATAGRVDPAALANKLANTVDTNKRIHQTYNPVNVVSVRRFDEARIIGAKKLEQAEQNGTESVTLPLLVTLLKTGN
jgi:hypothetical protein